MIIKSYEIQKNLSNFLKYNFYLLYGENNGLKKEIRESIKVTIKRKDSNLELLSLYDNDIISNKENFYNSIYSGSLFSKKKIITINYGTDEIINVIKDVVDKYPENILIIIISDILEKKSKLRNVFEANAKTELKKNNINLSQESINLLVEKSNSDRDNLKNELEKIKSFSLNKKKLELDEIKPIINFSGEYKSDSLINECLCGNILQYKKILSELYINTINYIFLLKILSNKIRRLLSLKMSRQNYNNLDSLINAFKPPIFWKEKTIIKKQLTVWNLNELKTTIHEINDVELLCKKKPTISKIVFFNFFNKICKKANNYS